MILIGVNFRRKKVCNILKISKSKFTLWLNSSHASWIWTTTTISPLPYHHYHITTNHQSTTTTHDHPRWPPTTPLPTITTSTLTTTTTTTPQPMTTIHHDHHHSQRWQRRPQGRGWERSRGQGIQGVPANFLFYIKKVLTTLTGWCTAPFLCCSHNATTTTHHTTTTHRTTTTTTMMATWATTTTTTQRQPPPPPTTAMAMAHTHGDHHHGCMSNNHGPSAITALLILSFAAPASASTFILSIARSSTQVLNLAKTSLALFLPVPPLSPLALPDRAHRCSIWQNRALLPPFLPAPPSLPSVLPDQARGCSIWQNRALLPPFLPAPLPHPQYCQIKHADAWFGKPSPTAPVSAHATPFILGIARSSTRVLDLANQVLLPLFLPAPPPSFLVLPDQVRGCLIWQSWANMPPQFAIS